MKLVPASATSAKVLVPLATMLAAGAVAIGSGASFSSESVHTATVTSGILHHTNDHDGVTLAIGKLQPGDSKTGSLIINNDGTLSSTLTLTPTNATDTFKPHTLTLTITESVNGQAKATPVYSGDFSGLASGVALDTEALNVGDTAVFTYTVTLANNTADDNANQNQSAGARFTYATTQLDKNANSTFGFNAISPSAAPTQVTPPTP